MFYLVSWVDVLKNFTFSVSCFVHSGEAGAQGRGHARQVLYHCAASSALAF